MQTTALTPPERADLALRLAVGGFEAGRWLLVDAANAVELVGDGIAQLLDGVAPEAGAPAAAALGDLGDLLPAGVARCVPEGAGYSLEATFAPVDATVADDVRAELWRFASTLGAPAERPALHRLLAAVAGRPAGSGPVERAATLVVLRRMDGAVPAPVPEEPPAELVALGPVLDELAALRAAVDAARIGSEGTADVVAALRRDVHAARAQADAARAEADGLRDELDGLREETGRQLTELGEAVRSAVLVSEDARREMRRALAEVEQTRAEVARGGAAAADEGGATVRAERVVEIWRQMIAAKAPQSLPHPGTDRRLDEHARPSIPGFDDADVPLAHARLDGRFERLNPAFARLVGYREADFLKATWPSLLDRTVYDGQLERSRALVAGEVDTVALDASYLGGDGLLVTVRGHVELVRDPSGEPSHLLLVGEDRHTL